MTQELNNPLQRAIPHTVIGQTNICRHHKLIISLSVPLFFLSFFLPLFYFIINPLSTPLYQSAYKRETLKTPVCCIHTCSAKNCLFDICLLVGIICFLGISLHTLLARDCCLPGICLFEVIRTISLPFLISLLPTARPPCPVPGLTLH